MAFISQAGESLGGNTGALRTANCLNDLEQVPTHQLLAFRMGTLKLYITPSPEIIQVLLLPSKQLLESVVHGSIQGSFRPLTQLFWGGAPRGVVGHVLRQMEWFIRLGIDREHDLAGVVRTLVSVGIPTRRLDCVFDAARQGHLAVVGRIAQHDALILGVAHLGKENPVFESTCTTRIASGRLTALLRDHFRGDNHRCLGIQHRYLIGDCGQVSVLE